MNRMHANVGMNMCSWSIFLISGMNLFSMAYRYSSLFILTICNRLINWNYQLTLISNNCQLREKMFSMQQNVFVR